MLSLVAIQERPDLEQARNVLIESNAEMRKELQQIEDRILYRLSVSEGSAVDDVDLILTLEASKVKSEQIKVRLDLELPAPCLPPTRPSYHAARKPGGSKNQEAGGEEGEIGKR